MTKKILILGGSSFIGGHFLNRLGNQATGTYNSRKIPGGIKFDAVRQNLSQVIKNPQEFTAAVILLGDTHPDSCAKDKKRSELLNVKSIKEIVRTLNQWQLPLIFTSTEFVYDGKKGNYTEKEVPRPILTYGKQKVAVEKFIQKICPQHIIVRFGKVYGSERDDGTLFTDWINQLKTEKSIRVAADQIFSPVYVEDVVRAILKLLEKKAWGLYNLGNESGFSRLQLLKMLISKMNDKQADGVKITACSIDDFPLLEKRPKNVSLNTNKIRRITGINIRPVGQVCELIVNKLR